MPDILDFRKFIKSRTPEEFHRLYIGLLSKLVSELQTEICRASGAGVGEPYLDEAFVLKRGAPVRFYIWILNTVVREGEGRCPSCGKKLPPGKRRFCTAECSNKFRQRSHKYRRDHKKILEAVKKEELARRASNSQGRPSAIPSLPQSDRK